MDDVKEVWKDIKGFEGRYQVSNLGRVKSLKRKVHQIHGEKTVYEKILRLRADKKGYLRIEIRELNGRKHCFQVHRLVAGAFIDNPQNKPQVNHINGIKK